jgi:cell division septum initiation protein DivIVA
MANPSTRQNKEDRTGNVGQAASDLKDRAMETGSQVAEKAKDTASSLAGQARDAASSVARTAGNVASSVGERASEAASSVGGGMKSLASTIRDKAPDSGMMGTAASSVADALDSSGRYLQEHGLRDLGGDLANLIRRNPFPALFVGIGIGYLFARATRS